LTSQSVSDSALPSASEQHGPLPLLRLSNQLLSSGRLRSCAYAAKCQTSSTISVTAVMAALKNILVIAISLKDKRFPSAVALPRRSALFLVALQLLPLGLPLARGSGSPIVAQVCGETGRKRTMKERNRALRFA